MKTRETVNRLLKAESEDEVSQIIQSVPEMRNEENWNPYGNVENNFGVIANQQSDALSALVEKFVNTTDALMMRVCYERGIHPESPEAPKSLQEAAEVFFGVPNGSLANVPDQERRRELADNAFLVATGSRSRPTLSMIDRGEGQHPRDFERTFLSLQASNKLRIPFVQGRFNMGGTGALPFCGREGYQLILSRRHPNTVLEGEENRWGWTLVKRRPPAKDERSPSYVYFRLNGEIPSFKAGPLPLIPQGEDPHVRELEGGSYIKMYEYKVSPATIVTADLYRRLNLKLFYLPVPITMYEARDYQSHSRAALLSGQRNRMEDVRFREDVVVRPDFPIESRIQIQKGEFINVKAWLLKEDVVTSRWTRPSEAICLTVNGQTHATYDRRFFSRDSVQKDYLKNHLMVEVDCSDLSTDLISDIFMASRDRIRNIEETHKMEKALERMFREDTTLQKYDTLWREKKLRERMDEGKSAIEILKGFMEASPEIAALLGKGNMLDIPKGMETDGVTRPDDPFRGEKFPSHLTLRKPDNGVLEIPEGKSRSIIYETDVENSYMSRPFNPGTLNIVKGSDWVQTSSLRSGNLILKIVPPKGSEVGDHTEVVIQLSSPHAGETGYFERAVQIGIVAVIEDEDKEPKEPKDPKDKLNLPLITGIREDEWEMFGWDEYSVATVNTYEGGADIYVNLDNRNLQHTLRSREYAGREEQIENLFKIGVGLIAFGLKSRVGDELLEETMENVMATIASVWLPTVLKLRHLL